MDNSLHDIHNALFSGAADILMPLAFPEGEKEAFSEEQKQLIGRACDMLQRVIEINLVNWRAYWLLGMGYKELNEHFQAYEAFKKSYSLEQSNADVARELAGVCIILGKGNEAVAFSKSALDLDPADAGLVANYGFALLIAGDLDAAQAAIQRSLEMEPHDEVTLDLQSLLELIQTGQIPRPVKWPLE